VFVVMIFERGTHDSYIDESVAAARRPAGVESDPMITRLGRKRSLIAVPSAKNSGFESISKLRFGRYALSCYKNCQRIHET
jgi:hypothetical protein